MGVTSQFAPPLKLRFLLLLSLGIQAAAADLHLTPATLAVLRGDVAEFTCSTANTDWTVMILSLNGKSILTIYNQTGLLPSPTNNHVTAKELVPGSPRKGWVFFLNTTHMSDETKVTCLLQGIAEESATLSVQEKGSVKVTGGDRLAFKDQQVQFHCEAPGWKPAPTLEWHKGSEKVSPGDYNLSIAQGSKESFVATSFLHLKAVGNSKVTCLASIPALSEPESGTVHLTIVKEAQEDRCMVPLAVTASFLGVAIFLLVLGCAVALWWKLESLTRSGSKPGTGSAPPSVSGRLSSTDTVTWRVNAGFYDEEPTDAAHDEQNTQSCFPTGSQTESVGIGEVPDVVSSSNLSLHNGSRAQSSLENSTVTRMITTV